MSATGLVRTPPRETNLFIAKRIMNKGCGLHGHDVFEIDFVVSGMAYSNINGKEYKVAKNSVLFLTPVDFHDFRNIGDEPVVTYNIIFATETMHKHVWSEIPMNCRVTTLDDDMYISLRKICECMLDEYERNIKDSENILRTGIEWILLMIAKAARSDAESHERMDEGIAAVLAYVFDNFTSKISREDVADIMHISPVHFSRKFHEKMGVSFQQYLLDLRLDYAKRLISTVELPVNKIATASGFNTVDYFSHAFIKKYGISPGKYAAQNREADF